MFCLHSFLWVNNISLQIYTVFCLSFHQLIHIRDIYTFWLLWIMLLWHLRINFCVNICFQFSWICTCTRLAGYTWELYVWLRTGQNVFPQWLNHCMPVPPRASRLHVDFNPSSHVDEVVRTPMLLTFYLLKFWLPFLEHDNVTVLYWENIDEIL